MWGHQIFLPYHLIISCLQDGSRSVCEVREGSVKQFLPIVQSLVTHTNIKPAIFGALPWGSSQLIR